MMRAYSVATLAKELGCSQSHVRKLIASGQLKAFRLGKKIIRIPTEAVEKLLCRNTLSAGAAESSNLCTTTPKEKGTGTRLPRLTAVRLSSLRRLSMQS